LRLSKILVALWGLLLQSFHLGNKKPWKSLYLSALNNVSNLHDSMKWEEIFHLEFFVLDVRCIIFELLVLVFEGLRAHQQHSEIK
jgi:hypothetical protein